MDKTKLVGWPRACVAHKMLRTFGILTSEICGELGGCQRGKRSAALFHNASLDTWLVVYGEYFVCVTNENGLNQITH